MKYDKRAKRIFVSVMICALACNLCGCGEKTVNYSVDDDASTEEGTTEAAADGARAAGKLADTLGIPVSCDVTFDNVAGIQISLNDDSIEVPDANSMGIVYYTPPSMDSAGIGKIVESLLDRSKDIYITESGADSDEDTAEDSTEAEQKKFTGTDYVYGTYTGEKNGTGYEVCVEADTDAGADVLKFSYDYSGAEYERLAASVDGAAQVYLCGEDGSDIEELENDCTLSMEQVVKLAMNFLDETGISGLTCDEDDISVLTVNWYDEDFEFVRTVADGYVVSFSRLIDGASVTDGEFIWPESSSGTYSVSFCSNDTVSVGINDDGVVYAYGTLYVAPDSPETEKTELLSWNELLDVLEDSLAEYYSMYPTNYSEIEFNQVSLAYLRYMDDEERQCFVPVWVLRQYDYDATSDGFLEQAAYISAIDGSCIDLYSYAANLGLYEE